MSFLPFLGLVAGALGVSCSVPQIRRLLRVRHADGISLTATTLGVAVCATWLCYGLAEADLAQIVTNTATTVGSSLTLSLVIRYGRHGWSTVARTLAVIPGWAVAAAFGYAVGGLRFLAVAATAASVARQGPQVFEALSGRPLWGLCPIALTVGQLSAALWLVYGVLQGDLPVVITSSLGVLCAGIILSRRLPPRAVQAAAANGRLGELGVVAAGLIPLPRTEITLPDTSRERVSPAA